MNLYKYKIQIKMYIKFFKFQKKYFMHCLINIKWTWKCVNIKESNEILKKYLAKFISFLIKQSYNNIF